MRNDQSPLPKGKFPNLPQRLFWEYNFDKIDWLKEATGIIQRVMERGTQEEWQQLVQFYGEKNIIFSLKNDINYLPDEVVSEACDYFKLASTELKCYTRTLSKQKR